MPNFPHCSELNGCIVSSSFTPKCSVLMTLCKNWNMLVIGLSVLLTNSISRSVITIQFVIKSKYRSFQQELYKELFSQARYTTSPVEKTSCVEKLETSCQALHQAGCHNEPNPLLFMQRNLKQRKLSQVVSGQGCSNIGLSSCWSPAQSCGAPRHFCPDDEDVGKAWPGNSQQLGQVIKTFPEQCLGNGKGNCKML